MTSIERKICVGLFGSCAGSLWREPYKRALEVNGIESFDPQVMPKTHGREWCEADIEREVRHLAEDPILMFKVNGQSASLLSFCEIITAINRKNQFIICIIEDLCVDPSDYPKDDPRIMTLRQALSDACPQLFAEPLKDYHKVRYWTRKAVQDCTSPLVTLVEDDPMGLTADEKAMGCIVRAAEWLKEKNRSLRQEVESCPAQ